MKEGEGGRPNGGEHGDGETYVSNRGESSALRFSRKNSAASPVDFPEVFCL